MQAGKTKADREKSIGMRAANRAEQNPLRKAARKTARDGKRVNAQSWESVAAVYASPEGIAKIKAEHKRQCETHKQFKASLKQQKKAAKAEEKTNEKVSSN